MHLNRETHRYEAQRSISLVDLVHVLEVLKPAAVPSVDDEITFSVNGTTFTCVREGIDWYNVTISANQPDKLYIDWAAIATLART